MAEQRLQGMVRGKMLLTAIKDEKLFEKHDRLSPYGIVHMEEAACG